MLLQNYQHILTSYQRLSEQGKGKNINKAKIATKSENVSQQITATKFF